MISEAQHNSSSEDDGDDLKHPAIVNQLRSELLDQRAASLNRWLSAVGLVLTFFGIVVTIAAYIGYTRLSELDKEIEAHLERAIAAVSQIEEHAGVADEIVSKMRKQSASTNTSEEPTDLDDATAESAWLSLMGFRPFVTESGSLPRRSHADQEFHLPAAGAYWFIADCDKDCGDLDLYIYGASDFDGAESSPILDKDVLEDAKPVVRYDATEPKDVRVNILMYDCDTSECDWNLRGYSKSEQETN